MPAMFKYPLDDFGYTTDMRNHTVRAERELYCKEIGEPPQFPMSDIERIEFEIMLSRKYRKEFIEYLKSIGGLEIGLKTIETQGCKSYLLNYYMERRRRNERETAFPVQHGEARPDDVA